MSDEKRRPANRAELRERALSRWDNEGGAGPDGPQEAAIGSGAWDSSAITRFSSAITRTWSCTSSALLNCDETDAAVVNISSI